MRAALAVVLVASASASPVPGSTPAPPSPLPSPSVAAAASIGRTPIEGCPQFFVKFRSDAFETCEERLRDAGWYPGPTLVSFVAVDGRARYAVTGAFRRGEPATRWDDDAFPSPRPAFLTYQPFGEGAPAREAGTYLVDGKGCGIRTFETHSADAPAVHRSRYVALVFAEAARHCSPFGVVRGEELSMSGGATATYVLFRPAPPGSVGSVFAPSPAEREAFRKRAAARGWQRLHEDPTIEVWGRIGGTVRTELALDDAGFEAAARRALSNGEILFDLSFDELGRFVAIWEQTGRPPRREAAL